MLKQKQSTLPASFCQNCRNFTTTMLSSKRTKRILNPSNTTASASTSYQSILSAETIAYNDDLLLLILLRLPIKSLLKFKCVSKHWLSLISNPEFSLHRNPSTNPTSGLFLRRTSGLTNPEFDFINLSSSPSRSPFRSLTFVSDRSGIKIMQSCNGLLLCFSFRGGERKRNYCIYNPTTKQYTILPPFYVSRGTSRTVFGVSLAFDPAKSPHYKVICVRNCDSLHNHYQIEIYSSKTGPWRLSGDPFATPNRRIQFNSGVFWNGAIHWISTWETSLCFDVDEQQIKEMPMPPIPDGWDKRRCRYFGKSRDHLHIIEIYGPPTTHFNVYEMERDYSGWFVKYHVDLDAVAAAFPEITTSCLDIWDLNYFGFSILCLVREERDEDSYLVLHIPGKAIRYNFKDQNFEKLCDFALDRRDSALQHRDIVVVEDESSLKFDYSDAFQFIESLACV